MMQVKIPLGSEINRVENNVIKIKVPNTKFWVQGEQRTDSKWNIYLADPQSKYKEIIKKAITTKAFAIFSNVILKSPFPYAGKNTNSIEIIKFIKKITKI